MKIVFVITDLGSFNNFLSELALTLIQNKELELHIICSNYKVIAIPDKIHFKGKNIFFHFIHIPRSVNLKHQLIAAYKIRKILDTIKPNLIHAHFTTGIFPTILWKNKHYVYWATFHGLGMNSSTGIRKFLFTIIESFCFYRLDKIFLLNKEDYNLLLTLQSTKGVQYRSKGVGCDIQKFNRLNFDDEYRQRIKKNLAINAQFVICFTGRFVDFKGFHLVVKSFICLSEKYPNKFKLLLMGGNDSVHSNGLNPFDQAQMDKHKDIINIGYTGEVAHYLSISDLFLFPSKKEGLPTCVLEAVAMGVPVITMDSRGNNDIINDGYNGFLINASLSTDEIINQIISHIETLYFNDALRTRLSANALNDREIVSRERFIEEHTYFYSQIIG